jgi:uncharacterized protein YggE
MTKRALIVMILTAASVLLAANPALSQGAGNKAAANAVQNPSQGDGNGNRRFPANYGPGSVEQIASEQPNLMVTTFQFIDAKVLTSIPTKTYVAVFGLNQEADRLEEANRRILDQTSRLRQALVTLGVGADDIFLDYISQTRTYDYQIKDNTAREKQAGYQIKENLSIRFRERALLDRIVPLAAQFGVYDLIKVEYQTEDLAAIRARMMEEAQKIIRKKEASYAALGVKITPVSIAAEVFDAFQPYDAYSAYRAFETGSVDDNYRVVERRKNSTLYFDPLDPARFDAVLAPVGLEPQVQCAFMVRVKYVVDRHTTVVLLPGEEPAGRGGL